MKHIRILIPILCIAILSGCTGRLGKAATHFYYLRNDIEYTDPAGVIAPETPDNLDQSAPLDEQIAQYLSGPYSDSLHSPFPENIELLSAEQNDGTVVLVFNERLGSLTGMDLTLACACLTMTCLELTDSVNVSIRAEGATLDGAAQISMNKDSLVLLDSSQ